MPDCELSLRITKLEEAVEKLQQTVILNQETCMSAISLVFGEIKNIYTRLKTDNNLVKYVKKKFNF